MKKQKPEGARKGPQVGIFYLIDKRLYHQTTPVESIKALGGTKAHLRQHYHLWKDVQRGPPGLQELDCYSMPSGRVSFNEATQTSQLLADEHILSDPGLSSEIAAAMNLEGSKVTVGSDTHYPCSLCGPQEKRAHLG